MLLEGDKIPFEIRHIVLMGLEFPAGFGVTFEGISLTPVGLVSFVSFVGDCVIMSIKI